jgi:kanamycin kinase
VPDVVRSIAAGRPVHVVWENELGGLTFAVGADPDRCFVKWAPAGSPLDFPAEADRLAWAGRYISVPRVLAIGTDPFQSWLVTAAVPGESAVSPRWIAQPATAVAAIGAGLRALHDALPVEACPFTWSVRDRLESVGRSALLREAPTIDHLVVCHGDACSPNTLIGSDGRWSGHVDVGAMGVADRWADLAVATMSTGWNYGPGWEDALLDAYGIGPDPERTAFYRMLWDLDP